jgi:PAS domain-containing protein
MYSPPGLRQIRPDELTAEARRRLAEELITSLGQDPYLHDVPEEYRLLLNLEGRCLEVSDALCRLLGYGNSEILEKTLQDLTAPTTANIPKHIGAVFQCDYMQGLWLLVHRQGTRILVRHESQLLPELLIEMRMDPIGAGH